MSTIFDENGKFVKQIFLGCTLKSFNAQKNPNGTVSYSAILQQEQGQTFEPDLFLNRGIFEEFEIDIGPISTSGNLVSFSRDIINPAGSGNISVQLNESIAVLSQVVLGRLRSDIETEFSTQGGENASQTVKDRLNQKLEVLDEIEVVSIKRRDEYVDATLEKLSELHENEIISLSEGVDGLSSAINKHVEGIVTLTDEEIEQERFSFTKYQLQVGGPPKVTLINVPDVPDVLPNQIQIQFSSQGITTTYQTEKVKNSSALKLADDNFSAVGDLVRRGTNQIQERKEDLKKFCSSLSSFDNDDFDDDFPEDDDFDPCSTISQCTSSVTVPGTYDTVIGLDECDRTERRYNRDQQARRRSYERQKPAGGMGIITGQDFSGPFYRVRKLNNKDFDPQSFSGFALPTSFLPLWDNVRNLGEPSSSPGYLLPGTRVTVSIFHEDDNPARPGIAFTEVSISQLVGKIIGNNNGRLYSISRLDGKTPDSWSRVVNTAETAGAKIGYLPIDTVVQVQLDQNYTPFIQMNPSVFAPPG